MAISISKEKKILVLGGGAGALASATMLQNAGFRVKILEKNPEIGGKLNSDSYEGFTFDTGPSILTLPSILRELFSNTGASVEDYLQLVNLDPQWRCFFDDGTSFDFRSGEEAMLSELENFAPGDVDSFRELMLRAREMYRISEDNFFFKDYGNMLDVVRGGNSRPMEALKLVFSIRPHQSYADLVDRYIKNPYLRQALEHLPQYVGSSPFLSPAILACLINVQIEKGCWYPMGGMNQISKALAKRFQELGGEVELNTRVERVFSDGDSIRGVECQGGKLWTADHYVVNMDSNSFAVKLGDEPSDPKRLSCSGVTIFLGLNKKARHLAHHNFFFSKDHKEEFKNIYQRGLPHNDPTVYACVPSKTDPGVAPEGKENVFLLIHNPVLNESIDWDDYIGNYREVIFNKLKRQGFDITEHDICFEKTATPKNIGERWGTYYGNIYGLASHGKLQGGFKKGNADRRFKNLQYAGGTVNPGAGVPMSLMSGMIAASNLIQKELSLGQIRL